MDIYNKEVSNEKFKPLGISILDSKNRITLGNKITKEIPLNDMEIDSFEIFIGDEGDILLRPMANIPSKELWIYQNPNVLKRIQKGLRDAQAGNIKEAKNVKKFLKNL